MALFALALKEEKKYKRKKKKVGSYQYGGVVVSISLALIVIGLFGATVLHTKQITDLVKENFEVSIFLKKDITRNQRTRIENELTSSDYLLVKEDQPEVRFKSKEEAMKEFVAETGEDFSAMLGNNPLRDALSINIKPAYQDSIRLDSICQHIEGISGVYEAGYSPDVIDNIERNTTRIGIWLLVIAGVLLIVVVLLINNSIKLALFSQRFLIRSMQLVGATSSFIKRPFLSRSFFHGVLAGIIASGVVYGVLQGLYQWVDQLSELKQDLYIFALFSALIVLGGLIAWLSTMRAINKYLKMSLDELY